MKTGTVITQQGCDFSVPVSSARDLRSNPDRSLGSFVRNHRRKKKKQKKYTISSIWLPVSQT